MKYLILFLFLCSCVVRIDHPIDIAFRPYVETFEHISGRVVVIPIVFDSFYNANENGECVDHSLIKINIAHWNAMSTTDDMKEELIFHELGHCVLWREHNDSMGQVGIFFSVPVSIMYEHEFGQQAWYKTYKQYYYQELVENAVF